MNPDGPYRPFLNDSFGTFPMNFRDLLRGVNKRARQVPMVALVIVAIVSLGLGGHMIQQSSRVGLQAAVQDWNCGLDSCNVKVAVSSTRKTTTDVGLHITIYGPSRYFKRAIGMQHFVGQLGANEAKNVELSVPLQKTPGRAPYKVDKVLFKVEADAYVSARPALNPEFQAARNDG